MFRRVLTFGALVAFVGCLARRPFPHLPPPGAPGGMIRLGGKEIPADEAVVREEVGRLVQPGMPLEQATAVLEEQLPGGRLAGPVSPDLRGRLPWPGGIGIRPLTHFSDRPLVSEWGQDRARVGALLFLDAGGALAEVKVRVDGGYVEADRDYFKAHTELDEPVGLSLAEAQTRMRATGFRCVRAAGTEPGGRGREHVLCEARDDRFLDGRMVRVRLFHDEAGVVCDTDILGKRRLFDAERAMLPFAEDPAAEYALRAALFPLHDAARFAVYATLAGLGSMPYGGGGHICVHGR